MQRRTRVLPVLVLAGLASVPLAQSADAPADVSAGAPATAATTSAPAAQDEPAYLGISYSEPDGGGVLVTQVIPGTPAERAGLQAGDLLVRAGGQGLANGGALLDVLRSRSAGDSLELEVHRGDQTLSVDVLLASRAHPGGVTHEPEEGTEQHRDAAGTEEELLRRATRELAPQEAQPSGGPAFLGIYPSDSDAGVRIDGVVDGSPAAAAGLQQGDVLVAIDGQPVSGLDGLRALLADRSAGAPVYLEVRRNGEVRAVRAVLGRRDASQEEVETQELHEAPSHADADHEHEDHDLGAEVRGLEQRPEPAPQADADRSRNEFLAQIPEGQRGVLGVYLDGDADGAPRIQDTIPGTPAAQAGLKAGDRIVRVAGRDVASLADLQAVLRDRAVGRSFPIVVERDGDRMRLQVQLAPRPGADRSEEAPRGDDARRDRGGSDERPRRGDSDERPRRGGDQDRADVGRMLDDFRGLQDRELRAMQQDIEGQLRGLREKMEDRENTLQEELERMRGRLGDDDAMRQQLDRMREGLRQWREQNAAAIEKQSQALRDRARARAEALRRMLGERQGPQDRDQAAPRRLRVLSPDDLQVERDGAGIRVRAGDDARWIEIPGASGDGQHVYRLRNGSNGEDYEVRVRVEGDDDAHSGDAHSGDADEDHERDSRGPQGVLQRRGDADDARASLDELRSQVQALRDEVQELRQVLRQRRQRD